MYRVENGECPGHRRLSQFGTPFSDCSFKKLNRLDLRRCRLPFHRVSIVDDQAIALKTMANESSLLDA